MNDHEYPWWQTTTIYQIYPRSFSDSDGDGIGDLTGVINKLDYIRDLGFETIWFSPFYCSPQQDFGYDVSNYYDIAPEYGSLDAAEELIEAVHARGMRVLFDLVLNHTSIEHPWFQESRQSLHNAKRDWYIWQPGRGSRPPNNWRAVPSGSGWHYDDLTSEYYYASFLPFQPDLNWRNPAVKQAMLDVVRFWLDKGVDGFRLDIFHTIFKNRDFLDNPFSRYFIPKGEEFGFFQEYKYTQNQPEVFDLAVEMRSLIDSYTPERMLIGEVFGNIEQQKRFLGAGQDGLNLAFLWELLNVKGQASFLRRVMRHYETHYPVPYTPVYVFGNHDRKRLGSLLGGNIRLTKLLAVFQFSVRGVPVTYYGEEIGMEDGAFPARTALDPIGKRFRWVPQFLADRLGVYTNRDGCRTPMQWDSSLNAGFCDEWSTPWLPVHENRITVNVQDQLADGDSLLNLYRQLLKLRRETPALSVGSLELIDNPDVDHDLLVYKRSVGDHTILVVLNFGSRSVQFVNQTACQRVLLSVGMEDPTAWAYFQLPPFAGIILSK